MVVAKRFIIHGRVQGVGYRYFAIHAAQSCNIVGTVRNLPDGTVEAIAEGTPEDVARFKQELERGPSYSRVIRVDESELIPSGRYKNFAVTY